VGPGAIMEMAEERNFPVYTGHLKFLQAQLGTVLTELSKLICILVWKLFCAGMLV